MEENGEVVLKDCFVQLEMLNLEEYDSDSSIDLPVPVYLRPTTKKSKIKKSHEELLLESQSLADNINIDTVQDNNMEEKLRTLVIIEDPQLDDESSTPPFLKEEKDFHIFAVKDSLQFFSKLDVTPSLCGYKNRIEFTAFEKKILSTKNVELEHVISSFLFSANVYCISDCKSFVTYLLKNLSVHEDVATINACYFVLDMLLTKHVEAKNLAFSTADIFMLLFNYGVDINSFQFLQQWPDVINHLEVPTKSNTSRIPNKWTLNLKKILKAVIKLLSTCTFKATDLCKITVFFLWMCLDTTLVQENLYSVIKECISASLNRITKDVWKKTLCDIVRIILSMEFSSEKVKWKNIAFMTEAVPVDSEKGIQLRKQISFLALNSICIRNIEPEIEDRFGFNLFELQHLLEKLKEIDTTLMSSATKFVDICIRHLSTTKEETQELLNTLKLSESHLDETAQEAKTHLAKIHFKLKLLIGGNKFKMYQLSPHKRRKGTPKKMEGIEGLELVSFDLRKVKVEEPNSREDHVNESRSLEFPSSNIVEKEYFENDNYLENNEVLSKNSIVEVNLKEQVNGSNNLDLMSNNITVKKEHIDDNDDYSENHGVEFMDIEEHELSDSSGDEKRLIKSFEPVEENINDPVIVEADSSCDTNSVRNSVLEFPSSNVIVQKECFDKNNYLENNEVLFENSIVKVNVKEQVNGSNNLELMSNNITVKKEHIDDNDEYSENHAVKFVDIEEHEQVNGSNNLELMSNNITVKKEHIDDNDDYSENHAVKFVDIEEHEQVNGSNNLELMSSNITVKKEHIDDNDDYSENHAVKFVDIEEHEQVNGSNNLELMSNNITVKKEHIDDNDDYSENHAVEFVDIEEHELSDSSGDEKRLINSFEPVKENINGPVIVETGSSCDANSVNVSADPASGCLTEKNVDSIAVTQATMCDSHVQETCIESELRMKDSLISLVSPISTEKPIIIETFSVVGSELVEVEKSSQLSQENINDPVIVETSSSRDTNSVNVSVDPASVCLSEKSVDSIAVTQATMCDSNVQEICIESELRMKDSLISLVSPISTEKPIIIETFSVAGSELVEGGKSSQLSQDLALVPSGDTMHHEHNAILHPGDESKSILIDEDFEIAQKSQRKDFGYDSSKMDVSSEESEVRELTMHAVEKNEEVLVRTSRWIETCMDEEILFEDVNEEANDRTIELEDNMKITYENNKPYATVSSLDPINNCCGEILNNVLSSVDAMTDVYVEISANQALDDESSAVSIGTKQCDLNINIDTESLLNTQQNSVNEQNRCISSSLKSKQRSKKHRNSSMAKDFKSVVEDDVRDRKKVLMKRKRSSLGWCKSITKKYKVKHFKVHNIDRDVANALESVVVSSVASCQSPTSHRKSVSNSVAERSKNFVQEFDSSTNVRESSGTAVVKGLAGKELSVQKYPLGKILSGEPSVLNESRSCPSTPVHFSGVRIKRSNSFIGHTKYHNQEFHNTSTSSVFKHEEGSMLVDSSTKTEDPANTYEMDKVQNRKRKLSDPHDLSSSMIRNNFVLKLKGLDGGNSADRKKLRQSSVEYSPKRSPIKFSPKKPLSPKKSPHKFFDYMQRKQKYISLSRQKHKSLLSKSGANLTKILRGKLMPGSSPDEVQTVLSPSSDEVQTVLSPSSDESDSDVMELYVDPKRFADKECMIIYETPEQIVIDSD